MSVNHIPTLNISELLNNQMIYWNKTHIRVVLGEFQDVSLIPTLNISDLWNNHVVRKRRET